MADPSKYYELMNFATDYYLSSDGSSVTAGTSSTYWQYARCDDYPGSNYFLRNTLDHCLYSDNNGNVAEHACTRDDHLWSGNYFNGVNASDGYGYYYDAPGGSPEGDLGVNPDTNAIEVQIIFASEGPAKGGQIMWGLTEATDLTPGSLDFCTDTSVVSTTPISTPTTTPDTTTPTTTPSQTTDEAPVTDTPPSSPTPETTEVVTATVQPETTETTTPSPSTPDTTAPQQTTIVTPGSPNVAPATIQTGSTGPPISSDDLRGQSQTTSGPATVTVTQPSASSAPMSTTSLMTSGSRATKSSWRKLGMGLMFGVAFLGGV